MVFLSADHALMTLCDWREAILAAATRHRRQFALVEALASTDERQQGAAE